MSTWPPISSKPWLNKALRWWGDDLAEVIVGLILIQTLGAAGAIVGIIVAALHAATDLHPLFGLVFFPVPSVVFGVCVLYSWLRWEVFK